jgi:hypothetical protein
VGYAGVHVPSGTAAFDMDVRTRGREFDSPDAHTRSFATQSLLATQPQRIFIIITGELLTLDLLVK